MQRKKSSERGFITNFALAGIATSGACIGSNPMEVVKTRMQLQGELASQGAPRLYKNAFDAFYQICKLEGLSGIQRGLFAGMVYQTFMNGTRLGLFEPAQKLYGATDPDSSTYALRNISAGATTGIFGAMVGSPFYLVKARIQAASSSATCINSQYNYSGMFDGIRQILRTDGILGMFRGLNGAMPRVAVGSAAQLSSYASFKHFVKSKLGYEDSVVTHLIASSMSGLVVTTAMNPFDVVSTRLYTQKVINGKGILYDGVLDCFVKTFKAEGVFGFSKGWTAHYLRVGPHTILTFLLWEQVKRIASDLGL